MGLGVQPPGGSSSGAILLIDASNRRCPDRGRAWRRARVPRRAQERPAGRGRRFGPRTASSPSSRPTRRSSPRRQQDPRTRGGHAHLRRADQHVRAREGRGSADDHRPPLRRHGRRELGVDLRGARGSRGGERKRHLGRPEVGAVRPGHAEGSRGADRRLLRGEREPQRLEPIFEAIGQRLSNEYEVTYRSVLPPERQAVVEARVSRLAPASATYTTPLDVAPAARSSGSGSTT